MKHLLTAFFTLFLTLSAQAAPIEFTDLAGRHVVLDKPVTKFGLSEGRYIATLSLLRPDHPTEGLVGMMSPLSWTHPLMEKQLFDKHPEAKEIKVFGAKGADSVSAEKIIDLQPEVIILGLSDHGPNSKAKELLDQLEAAGIKIVFIDFRQDPLVNTIPSLKILGQIFGVMDRAQAYIDFYQNRLSTIRTRLEKVNDKPRVFLQVHAGRRECCWGMADGMLGPFVEAAGGENIADKVAPGPTALHTHEFLLLENPDIWIATASGTLPEFQAGSLPVATGPGMTPPMAEESLARYLAAREFQAMDAIKNGRAHAFWHNFYNSPLNIVVLEALAKWIHPNVFHDLDPQKTLSMLYKRFMPFQLDGTYFTTYHHDK
jgi:iron complex transport system substrate-binding protein